MKTLIYNDISLCVWRNIQAALAEQGVPVDASAGQVKKFGADVYYSYSAATHSLRIDIRSAPVFHTMDGFAHAIDTGIRHAIQVASQPGESSPPGASPAPD